MEQFHRVRNHRFRHIRRLAPAQDGLPIGSQFAAAKGREDLLYALAYELEAAQPWTTRTPTVWMG